ncbi:class III lanthipeptide [Streptomyces showdoensis]|nr:class III lanthipeptide [Streptomyces showdoensis]
MSVLKLQNLQPRIPNAGIGGGSYTSSASDCCNRDTE